MKDYLEAQQVEKNEVLDTLHTTLETTLENYRQEFMGAEANERERIFEILHELAKEEEVYKALITELENYEKEEDLNFGEDYSPKQEI